MPDKCLFHVKDADRPMYIAAIDWGQAIEKWKAAVAIENEMAAEDVTEPLGIDFICDSQDLML